jgi:transcriptional regulator with XRE-family HTH domain
MNKGLPTITESIEELRQMLRREGDSRKKQRLQALYLLQTRQASSRKEVARLLGVNRDTIGRWLSDYASGGVSVLLNLYRAVGKRPTIYGQILEGLQQKL